MSRYCNPDYNALFQQMQTELDPRNRRKLLIQMNDLLINDVAVIPVIDRGEVTGISNRIIGLEFTPWDTRTWKIENWQPRLP